MFAERGYDGAGVAEIARRAGVTTGAIYSRFRGKAELLAAALDARTADEFDALFADHRFEGRTEDILTDRRQPPRRRADARPGRARCCSRRSSPPAATPPSPRCSAQPRRRAPRAACAEIIEAAKASGGIDDELDTDALVTFCHAVGLGFLLFEALDAPLPDTGAVGAADRPPRRRHRRPAALRPTPPPPNHHRPKETDHVHRRRDPRP